MDSLSNKLLNIENNIINSKIKYLNKDITYTLREFYNIQINRYQNVLGITYSNLKITKTLNHLIRHINNSKDTYLFYIKKNISLTFKMMSSRIHKQYTENIIYKFSILHKIIYHKKDLVYSKIKRRLVQREKKEKECKKIEKILNNLIYKMICEVVKKIKRSNNNNNSEEANVNNNSEDANVNNIKEEVNFNNIKKEECDKEVCLKEACDKTMDKKCNNIRKESDKEEVFLNFKTIEVSNLYIFYNENNNTIIRDNNNIIRDNENNIQDNTNIKEGTLLLNLHTSINNSFSRFNNLISLISLNTLKDNYIDTVKLKILLTLKNVKYFNKGISLYSKNNKIYKEDKISFILQKGSLDNDKRFLMMIDDTLIDIEKYKDPVVVRMGIQFILAKKYVEDIIYLKES